MLCSKSFILIACGVFVSVPVVLQGQFSAFREDFSGSTIDTDAWTVESSEAGSWGARITSGMLELTNTVDPDQSRANGAVFLHTAAPFSSRLEESPGSIAWSFNMQQIRTNPAGFGSNSYGAAFVLGATHSDFRNSGQGYAVVLGNTGTPDPLRLVYFDGGLSSLGTAQDTDLVVASAPLSDPRDNYMSVRVEYDPFQDEWSLFGRLDGTAGFEDPQAGILDFLGSAFSSDAPEQFTDVDFNFMGLYWQGSTAANQTAYFDNIDVSMAVTAVPEPRLAGVAGALLLILLATRRSLKRRQAG